MRCAHYNHTVTGIVVSNRCTEKATHLLITPEGLPSSGSYYCQPHGEIRIKEYAEKLDEIWKLVPIDEWGNQIEAGGRKE